MLIEKGLIYTLPTLSIGCSVSFVFEILFHMCGLKLECFYSMQAIGRLADMPRNMNSGLGKHLGKKLKGPAFSS